MKIDGLRLGFGILSFIIVVAFLFNDYNIPSSVLLFAIITNATVGVWNFSLAFKEEKVVNDGKHQKE